MKRAISFLLAFVLVLSMVPAVSFAAEVRTVYWDPASGADINDGLTETTPVKTVEAAYAALSGADEGTIRLLGTLTLTQQTTFPICAIPVTITGGEIATGSHLLFGGDTTLEHLKLTLTAANNTTYISAEGHKLTIGEGINCTNTTNRFCLTARYGEGSVDGAVLTVKSGKWHNVFAAGYKSATTGNATLNVYGGDVKNLLLPTYSGDVTGNTTINIYGGTLQVAGVAPNETGTITGDVDMNLFGGTIKKVRIRRDQKGSNIQGTATVTVDGDLGGVGIIENINPTGKITKTRLVLKQGILATTPCTFDEVSVEIPEGKTFTLKDCDITANTVNSQGTLLFSGKASMTAQKVIGSLSCDISGSVMEGQLYVTAPAGSSVIFPADTGITEAKGQWRAPGALDESTFRGLVLRAAKDVTVKLYTGYQDGSVVTPTYKVEGEQLISYYYADLPSGNYRSRCTGTGYYSTSQMIYMSPAEVSTCTVHLVTPDKRATTTANNWEPSQVLLYTDEMMAMNASNGDISQWPEYADIFTTPWFTENHAVHQQTTQAQMEAFLNNLDGDGDNMYLYSIGKSAHFEHNVWAAFLTKSDLSGAKTPEEAAARLDKTKPTVLYRAQIHGDEPGAGEAALAMIQRLDGAYGMEILEKINVVILPRTNPDGAQVNKRNLYDDLEPNHDSIVATSREITDFVHLYNLLMPEVVIDGHEYAAYSNYTYIWDADVLVGAGFTPANTDTFAELSEDMVLDTFAALGENDMTYRCYEQNLNAANPNVNRVYASKRGSYSFLLETRGNKAGLIYYPRRIVGQVIAAENLLNYTAENAHSILKTVAEERAAIVERGKTYRSDDTVALTIEKVASDLTFNLDRIYQNGNVKTLSYTPSVWSNVTRSRIAPTAYVIPAGASFTADVLEILDKQNISYTYIPAGSQVFLQQYIGTVDEATLTEEKQVTFGSGAYVMTLDQVGGIILNCMFEPDIKPASSLVSKGFISAVDGVFPIYRYCHDLNAAGFIHYTVSDAVAAHVTVYLDGTNGNDSNDGLSPASAVKTMEQAYAAMAMALQSAGDGSTGTVVISGIYELGTATYNFPSVSFPVIITGATPQDGISFTGGTAADQRYVKLWGDTTFENMYISVNNNYSANLLLANGHKLTVGEGVTTSAKKSDYYFAVVGGGYANEEIVPNTNITILSGNWRTVYVGGYRGSVTDTAKLTVRNATIHQGIYAAYVGNVNHLVMDLMDTTVASGSIFAGTATANSAQKIGAVQKGSTIILGKNVTAPALYCSAKTYGNVQGGVTLILKGADMTKLPVFARYSGLSAAYSTDWITVRLASNLTSDITLDEVMELDLGGYDITGNLTVDGTLTVYDSATDDYDVSDGLYGEITGTVNGTLAAADGYLPAADGFHKFGGQYISGVSLRPSNAGIYYTATFLADEVLLRELETGVAVSLTDMPDADFETDADTLYTAGTNSVLIQNILKGDAEDADRAITDIYAASYVKLPDGTVLVSDTEVAYSLYDILLILKETNPTAFESFCKAHNIVHWF